MSGFIGPLVVVSGLGLYFGANFWLGRFERVPYGAIAISLAGGIYSVMRAFVAPSATAIAAALASIGLLAFLYWFYFSFSMYAEREDRPRVGDRFPSFVLPASDGSLYDSAAAKPTRRLYIFYRGSW